MNLSCLSNSYAYLTNPKLHPSFSCRSYPLISTGLLLSDMHFCFLNIHTAASGRSHTYTYTHFHCFAVFPNHQLCEDVIQNTGVCTPFLQRSHNFSQVGKTWYHMWYSLSGMTKESDPTDIRSEIRNYGFTESDFLDLDLIFRPEIIWIWIWGIPIRNPIRYPKSIQNRNPKNPE